MTQASSLPLGVPAFKRIPPPPQREDDTFNIMLKQVVNTRRTPTLQYELPYTVSTKVTSAPPNPTMLYKVPSQQYPAFQLLPQSISRISNGHGVQFDRNSIQSLVSPYAHVSYSQHLEF